MQQTNKSMQQTAYETHLIPLSDAEFAVFQKLIFEWVGIHMAETKKALISGRLMKRLRYYRFTSFGEYLALVQSAAHADEKQTMINLITTNETYFFREHKHFDWLRERLKMHDTSQAFRIWSAAASSGHEAYSLAMTVADAIGFGAWEIYGSDISEKMLTIARAGVYPIADAAQIPENYLKHYCLKGVRSSEGTFRIGDEIKSRVQFFYVNLVDVLPKEFGLFDVIFLRNVMIYFNRETRHNVSEKLVRFLKPGGNLVIGHAESLHGITDKLRSIRPTIYATV